MSMVGSFSLQARLSAGESQTARSGATEALFIAAMIISFTTLFEGSSVLPTLTRHERELLGEILKGLGKTLILKVSILLCFV